MSSQTQRIIEWSALVQCKEHALGGSYSVLLFMGSIPDSPGDWRPSPSFVGMRTVYTALGGAPGGEENKDDDVVEGFVHLNTALIESGIQSLFPDDVVPFLKGALGWRVQKMSGEVVPYSQVDFLEIVVISVTMERSPDGGFPKPIGSPVYHYECTAGRPGGYSGHA
ncbi:hypothetical protein FRC03_006496 [Tulasnella sp. 419]|nr:hypothetical protein FRC03_006496 [Tulasnella sp. 419]